MRLLAAVILLAACDKTETPPSDLPDPLHGIEVPEVAGPGYVAAKGDASIIVTTRAIIVDGMSIVSLTNDEVGPEDKLGGAAGIMIPRLVTMGGKLAAKHVASPLILAFDRQVHYRLLVEALFSLKQKDSGWKNFGVLAKAKGAMVMVPISLPDKALPSAGFSKRFHVDDTSLTPDAVLAKVRTAYTTGLQQCYKTQLKTDPAMHGKLRVTFTVTPTGAVSKPKVVGLAAALDSCIQTAMTSWQFPIPRTRDASATEAAFEIALAVDNDDSAAPVTTAEPPPIEPAPGAEPVQMIVTAMRDKILVWSISGLEGTLQAPKATFEGTDSKAIAQVSTTLAEIVHRRWPSQRPEDSRSIIVMADGNTPIQTVAELFGAVRAAADGSVLFPDILLSSGFE